MKREELTRAAADAIYKTHVDRAREAAAGVNVDMNRLRRVFIAASQEADRSAAILLFALAEDVMLSGIQRNVNTSAAGGWKAVSEGNGLLATASDRIAFIELLRWARPSVCVDLRLMKSIRNRFAHHADVESFDDLKVAGWISTMTAAEEAPLDALRDMSKRDIKKPAGRALFLMRAFTVITGLVGDLAVLPAAYDQKVHPGDVYGEWEAGPENLRSLHNLAAEALLLCVPEVADLMVTVETPPKR